MLTFSAAKPFPRRRLRRWALLVVLASLVTAAQVLTAATAATGAKPFPGCAVYPSGDGKRMENHCYEAVNQELVRPQHLAHGVGANLYEDVPGRFTNGYSIAQITLANTDVPKGPGGVIHDYNSLEFGWVEQPSAYKGSPRAHLFFAVRQQRTAQTPQLCLITAPVPDCARGMWHPNPAAHFHLGDQTGPSGAPLYHVGYYVPDHSWWVQYGHEWLGRFDNTWWDDGFADGNSLNWQGEVAFNVGTSACVPMGNGDLGTAATASTIHGMFYEYFDPKGRSLIRRATAQAGQNNSKRYWTMGQLVDNGGGISGFAYGGPGKC